MKIAYSSVDYALISQGLSINDMPEGLTTSPRKL